MSEPTYYTGALTFTPPLTAAQVAWFSEWLSTDHARTPLLPGAVDGLPDPLREAVGLTCGRFGELYTGPIWHEALTASANGLHVVGNELGRWLNGTPNAQGGIDLCEHRVHVGEGCERRWDGQRGCERRWYGQHVIAPGSLLPIIEFPDYAIAVEHVDFDGQGDDELAKAVAWIQRRIFDKWGVVAEGVIRVECEDDTFPSWIKVAGRRVFECSVDEHAAKQYALDHGAEVTWP